MPPQALMPTQQGHCQYGQSRAEARPWQNGRGQARGSPAQGQGQAGVTAGGECGRIAAGAGDPGRAGAAANVLRCLSPHLRQLPPFRSLHSLWELKLQAQQPQGMLPDAGWQHCRDGPPACQHLQEPEPPAQPDPELFHNLTRLKEVRLARNELQASRAFHQLKNALMSAPALGLPDVSKPFFLFSHEKQGIALGILAQDLGPYRRAVAYLFKQLDATAKGWPGCLRAVAAVVLNIQEARKFTLGQKMTVLVSHTISAVLEVKGGHWLSPQRFLKYQAIMVEQDDVEIVVTNIVNPASFLSENQGEAVHHDCLETIEATYSSRPDLKDTPLDNAETWFTDRSSYITNGKQHAGYAVTTCREVIEAGPLPTGTSAQKTEIIALTRALERAKGRRINIYTDLRYAFGVVHAHGAIWKERGLLTSQGKNIKHAQEIVQLLEAVQLPEKVAIMHIKAYQKVSSELEEGNELADREAKEAAKGEVATEGVLIPDGQISLEEKTLEPQWEGPFQVLFTTFTAIKIKEQNA
ncbi:uncharacterized protein LOC134413700 [Melospiza melodia melodia]|uniref:uncharacterized protein LOC134413700 n=1 Tax=Melospiza melodia melodia TaxID=1914991 RepID=UPI002FD50777